MKHVPKSPRRPFAAALPVALVSGLAMMSALEAQISISGPSPVLQNFDTIGTSTTANLPADWKMTAAGVASPTWSAVGNLTATNQAASGGTPTTGGRYNWGNGTTTTDRAVGFMTSGSYASPNSVMAHYVNNTGGTITDLAISFDIERYRINTAAAAVTFFTSTDGTTWTAQTAGDSGAFATGASSYTFSGGTVVTKSFSITGLSIASGSPLYLRWNFNTTGSSSQGLGLDNVSLTATFTGDTTAPTITTYTPASNATGVPATTSSLVAVFSEPVVKGTGDITVKLISDNSTVFTIPVSGAAVSVSTSTATITLPSSLAGLTGYYVNIATGAFKDGSNNDFAGIADSATWAFTTAAIDSSPPAIASLTPADDSTTSAATANLFITYDEPVFANSGSLTIKRLSDDSTVETIPVPGALVSVAGSTVTVNPAAVLQYGTGYYVEIAAGTFRDAANNATLAVTGNSTWNFTTRNLPSVVISQYYEGNTAADRFIELRNLTASPLPLTGYRLAAWSDTSPSDNEGWKSGTNTTPRVTDLSAFTIPANGHLLIAEPNPTTPGYAANNLDVTTDAVDPSATDFDGDDSVVLYNGAGFSQAEIVDALSVSATQAANLSIYRIRDTMQGYDLNTGTSFLDFTGTWATKTLAEVNAASVGDPWYLSASQPPKILTLSITPSSFSEGAGASAATATVSLLAPAATDLSINVASSDSTEASVQDLVTIPTGQSSAQFPVNAVNDTYLDGNKSVTITVSAINYTPASQVVTVQDELTDPAFPVVINEVDADQTGTDGAEFIELYNTSAAPVSLDGVVVVLYNGSNDQSYKTIDLTGKTIGANDYFVIGSATVPNLDAEEFATDGIQNGADAVALYLGTVSEFPNNTPVSTTNGTLVDALVYDTDDADDSGLIAALTPGKPQINENGLTLGASQSMSRVPDGGAAFDTSLYVTQTPTPGATNVLSTGYSGWAATNAGGQTADLDFDNDGVDNGVEFFMNAAAGFTANPGLSGGTVTWPNGGNLLPGDYGTKFKLQTSTNLSSWNDVASDAPGLSNTTGSLSYTPTAPAPFFVRLVVTP